MMVRMKFLKTGPLKFIGHLDIMRYFQKTFRRAGIDVEYSKGYSPHQILSFAAPLGVGLTSEGEYLDVSINTMMDTDVMIQKINEAMNENIRITDLRILPEGSKNAMSIVAGADYKLSLRDGYDFLDKEEFVQKFQDYMNQNEIIVIKKSKKSENEVDIKPFIYQFAFERESFYHEAPAAAGVACELEAAQMFDNGICVYLKLATGSVNNLKPELVLEGFKNYVGLELSEFAFQVHRLEVYANDVDAGKFIPLLFV
ncbi:MAG: TIGR03936 family radical SAM-associated protein [Anaerocolumna sp.]